MGFSRQGYWNGLPFPSPGNLPDPGIEPGSLALQADTLPSEPQGKHYVVFKNAHLNQFTFKILGIWLASAVKTPNCFILSSLQFYPTRSTKWNHQSSFPFSTDWISQFKPFYFSSTWSPFSSFLISILIPYICPRKDRDEHENVQSLKVISTQYIIFKHHKTSKSHKIIN